MKKRLLAGIISLCMVVSMIPTSVFAAETGTEKVCEEGCTLAEGHEGDCVLSEKCTETDCILRYNHDGEHKAEEDKGVVTNAELSDTEWLQEAVNGGGEVTLEKDLVINARIIINNTVTLNLNGHTISNTEDIWSTSEGNWSLISVRENGNLTVKGNGTLAAKADDCYAIDLYDEGVKCTIENGEFIGNLASVYVFQGNLTINGGKFSIQQLSDGSEEQPWRFTLNCYDSNYRDGKATIKVNGGEFLHYDPSNGHNENPVANLVATGYSVIKEGDYYKVIESVAKIGDTYYATLQEAVAAALNGETVTLLKDIELNEKLTVNNNCTVDLNGKILYLKKSDNDITAGNNVIFKNGTINISSAENAGDGIIRIGIRDTASGTLTLDNVSIVGEGISSGAGTICLFNESKLNLLSSSITVENEKGGVAYVIYCNDGTQGVVNIEDSSINVTNGNSGIFSGIVTIKNSELNLNVRNNAINGNKNELKLVVDGSQIIASDANTDTDGRALTLWGASTAEFKNGSILVSENFAEAAIRYKSGTTGKVTVDATSRITMSGEKKLVVDDAKKEIALNEYSNYITIDQNYKFVEADGKVTLTCAHINTKLVDNKGATCTEEGYTGDKVCTFCGEVVEKGSVIAAKGHDFGPDGLCLNGCGTKGKIPATTVIEQPKKEISDTIKGEAAEEVANKVAGSVDVDNKALEESVSAIAEKLQSSEETVKEVNQVLKDNDIIVADGDKVSVVVKPYVKLEVKEVDNSAVAVEDKAIVTLDIKMVYDVVAQVKKADGSVATANVSKENPVTNPEPAQITFNVPSTLFTDEQKALISAGSLVLYMEHIKNDGSIVYHEVEMTGDTLSFYNDKGYSEFNLMIGKEVPADKPANQSSGSTGSSSIATFVDSGVAVSAELSVDESTISEGKQELRSLVGNSYSKYRLALAIDLHADLTRAARIKIQVDDVTTKDAVIILHKGANGWEVVPSEAGDGYVIGYFSSLSPVLVFVDRDGAAEAAQTATLVETITANGTKPVSTGDSANTVAYVALILVAGAALTFLYFQKKRS